MIQESKIVEAFSTSIRASCEVGLYYINGALLILNLAPLYYCKIRSDEKDTAEKEFSEMRTQANVDDKNLFLKFRKLQRNVFTDFDVQKQLTEFPWLRKVSIYFFNLQ